jgi:hypothetical protein
MRKPHPEAALGVNFLSPQTDDQGWQTCLDRLVELRLDWVRAYPARWLEIETRRGVYDWSRLDQLINACEQAGSRVYANIGCGNALYLPDPMGYSPLRDPKAEAAWRQYLAAMVQRYRGRVQAYEVYNEANAHGRGDPDVRDPAGYAAMVSAASQVVREHDPDALVLAGATAGLAEKWAAQVVGLAGGDFDVWVYHHYRTMPEGVQDDWLEVQNAPDRPYLTRRDPAGTWPYVREVGELRNLLREAGFTGPLWQGECGYAATADSTNSRGHGPWSPRIQAKWLLRAALCDLMAGAELSSYFLLCDFSPFVSGYGSKQADADEGRRFNTKGLLDLEHGLQPRPGHAALGRLSALLRHRGLAETESGALALDDVVGLHPDLTTAGTCSVRLRPAAGSGEGVAWWSPQRHADRVQAGAVRIRLPDAGEWRLIDPLQGRVWPVEVRAGRSTVPIVDYPLVLLPGAAVGEELRGWLTPDQADPRDVVG